MRNKTSDLNLISNLWKWLKKPIQIFFWIILIVFIVRNSWLEIHRVPSDSMKNALRSDDYIITDRLLYSGLISQILGRLGVNGHLSLNDIVVFKLSAQGKTIVYVKRCVGLPGQTFEIKKGNVLVDGRLIEEPATVRHLYKLWYSDRHLFQNCLQEKQIDLSENVLQKSSGYFVVHLDNVQKESLTQSSGIDSITRFNFDDNDIEYNSDPLKYGTELQNLQPMVIPFNGMKISLNTSSLAAYKDILSKYEGVMVPSKEDTEYSDPIRQQYYTFKNDYYFVMGDNRSNSIDSRTFGLVPGRSLEGKVVFKF